MTYTDIKIDDIKRDLVIFEKGWESTPYTVLDTTTTKNGKDMVVIESNSGVVYTCTTYKLLNDYVTKVDHGLKSGDVFQIVGSKVYFLYVDERSVVRIGTDLENSYYGSVSHQPLQGYVDEIADGDYGKIVKRRNITSSLGITVAKKS